jgi:hypothetical protein
MDVPLFVPFLMNKYCLVILWKHMEKRSIKIKNKFAESSKDKKYEESCLRSYYFYNDYLSRKPIVQ